MTYNLPCKLIPLIQIYSLSQSIKFSQHASVFRNTTPDFFVDADYQSWLDIATFVDICHIWLDTKAVCYLKKPAIVGNCAYDKGYM